MAECANSLDDGEKGLLAILQTERKACSLSSEDVLGYITEWRTLARKHGISPYVLPPCHASLRQELDGNVEARTLLPEAIEAEINGASQPLASASSQRGGKVDLVASSGEKEQILLAIECEIPGPPFLV